MKEKNEFQFHKYKRINERLLERFEEDKTMSESNKAILRDYLKSLYVGSLSLARINKVFYQTCMLTKWLGKEWSTAGKQDITDLVLDINKRKYAEHTKLDFRVSIKRFCKWFKGNGEEYPEMAKWIKTTLAYNQSTLPEEIITEQEAVETIKACNNERDKAFVSLLWETGARIGEIGTARIKNIQFNEDSTEAQIRLNGKTGSRRVLLISSVPYLKAWLSRHPSKTNPESSLFVNIGLTNLGKPTEYANMRKLLANVMHRAGIQKDTNPHLWRHSRATYLAGYLTEAQLCEVMGWAIGSKMPRTYVHLSGKAVSDAVRNIYGLGQQHKKEESQLKPLQCKICGHLNTFENKDYCENCNNPLTLEASLFKKQKQEIQTQTIQSQNEMLSVMLGKIEELMKWKESQETLIQNITKEHFEKERMLIKAKTG